MYAALRQLPDQPRLHRAEQQLSGLRLLSGALHIVQDPFDLRRREIGVDDKPRLFPEFIRQSLLLQAVCILRCAAALPHDGIVDRSSRFLIPYHHRLPLVRDPDRRNIRRRGIDVRHRLSRHLVLCRPDLIRVMLHPSRFRKILRKLLLRHAAHIPLFVKQDAAVAGGPRIQCHYVFCHTVPP